MLITCKCLNISIDSQSSDICGVDPATCGLSFSEEIDSFFKENLTVVEHGRISKIQTGLVKIRNVGDWIVHFCLNCSTHTHAIHRDKGAAVVVVNKDMLTNPAEISALKSSEAYSNIFRIVIRHIGDDFENPKISDLQLPLSIQTGLASLQQQLAEALRNETMKIEESIRRYSEQQYAELEEFREKAHREHNALAKLLSEIRENKSESGSDVASLETPPSTPETYNVSLTLAHSNDFHLLRSPLSDLQNKITVRSSPISMQKGSSVRNIQSVNNQKTSPVNIPSRKRLLGRSSHSFGGSFDVEGLFPLEGLEDMHEIPQSGDDTDTDTESAAHDDGVQIPMRGVQSVAKSLPVDVPIHMVGKKGLQEDEIPKDPMDIAASIQALARSVRGDAGVFGDLPQPRFSTQI